ncbi:DUF2155 domain-containing protein [Pelagerythrobacter marensis]|uniref:DUF2155 domain-containing protein n=1 Tax=Pelagerythrobacter marensis TaxID=543877 RepID=A0ABZ2D5X8_9SPHN
MRALAAMLPLAVAMAGCAQEPPAPEPVETEVPEELATPQAPEVVQESSEGTPMEERVATLGLLNKRNNLSQDLEMKPGESRRVGDVIVRLAACERTAPWEMPRETGAFVQVLVRNAASSGEGQWQKIFSGWLFRNSPSLNVVEHPIYDVWVKDCAMSFPGEDDGAASASANSAE